MNLEDIDKKILNVFFNERDPSYPKVAEKTGVSRATVYRRLKKLEKEGKIHRGGMILPDYKELGLRLINIGISIPEKDEHKAADILKKIEPINVLFRSFIKHNIIALMITEEEEYGEKIKNIKKRLSENNIKVNEMDVSVSVSIEKVNFLPHFNSL